jgi:hypothetical protein
MCPTYVICDLLFVTRLNRMEAVVMKVRRSGDSSRLIETSTLALYFSPDTVYLALRFSVIFLSSSRHILGYYNQACKEVDTSYML